jgi:hypothetical protein
VTVIRCRTPHFPVRLHDIEHEQSYLLPFRRYYEGYTFIVFLMRCLCLV